jgi:uncharacterized protein (DUF488 family)
VSTAAALWSVDPVRLFTIGHSTRTLEQFFGLLEREGATHLVDVRAFPASARYPHFSRENLQRTLIDSGRRYTHLASLGGRRRGRRDSHNTQWKNSGFRAYADYMETREFAEAVEDLLSLARLEPTAIMCAEAVPWRCHRTLISDAVVAAGADVFHVLDGGAHAHELTSFARVENGRVRYDAGTQKDLFQASRSQ